MHQTNPPGTAPHDTPANPQASTVVERFVRLPELLSITGESRTQCYENISTGLHPAPRKDGRASLWVMSEVQAYVAQKIARLPRKG
jgi:predicted DNA-binding transcriptional regulator AlpA